MSCMSARGQRIAYYPSQLGDVWDRLLCDSYHKTDNTTVSILYKYIYNIANVIQTSQMILYIKRISDTTATDPRKLWC